MKVSNYPRAESLSNMTKLSGRRRSNNPNAAVGPILGMVEYDHKNYESNQTEDKSNYNKFGTSTKKAIKSPKRAAKQGINSKQVNFNSVERDGRKDKKEHTKNFDNKKTSNSVSKDVFHTLYSLKKNDVIHSSSLNNFQQVKKSEYQTIGNKDKSKVIESTPSKTPGKFKKSTYLNSYKKVS